MQLIAFRVFRKIFITLRISGLWKKIISSQGMSGEALKSIPRHGKCVFQVVGVPRSGTTLLAASLDNHSGMVCLIEPYLSWLQRGYFELDGAKSLNIRKGQYSKPPHYYIAQLCKHSILKFVGFKETFRSERHPTYPTKPFITRNVREKCVDATIAIVRDPRDVWASVINRAGSLEHKTPIEEIIPDWNIFSQWILDNSAFFVRYEDLVLKPVQTYQSIGNYLGFKFSSDMLEIREKKGAGDERAQQGGRIISHSVGRHRDDLSVDVRKLIQRHCGGLMKKFGYK